MNQILQRPYEISVWEDRLVADKEYYEEIKIATIGSSTMTAPHRAYNPILTKNVNGEIRFSFQIAHRYFDETLGQIVTNPIEKYLVNERKVKLLYGDEWYDFIIKNCDESTDGDVFTYELTGLFVNELGKVGYNTVLANELQNNFGTIFELGATAVKDTDWVIDKENSDIIQQYVGEPLYRFVAGGAVAADKINRLDGGESKAITAGKVLLVFYSQIANQVENNFQFLREDEESTFTHDDNNIATGINYEFVDDVSMTPSETGTVTSFTVDNVTFTLDFQKPIQLSYQGYRLAYNQRIAYDTITERPVVLYKIDETDTSDEQIVYKYTDYEYASSDVITNFVTNGSGFNIYSDGSLEGWTNATQVEFDGTPKLQQMDLTTWPSINQNQILSSLSTYAKIEGFLRVKFNGALSTSDGTRKNVIYNNGIKDRTDEVSSFIQGEQYVLRTRFGVADDASGEPLQYSGSGKLRAFISEYTLEPQTIHKDQDDAVGSVAYLHTPDLTKIYFDFDGGFTKKNTIVKSGRFSGGETTKGDVTGYPFYVDDQTGVVVTPTLNSCYVASNDDQNNEYVWDAKAELYVPNNAKFLDYYYTIATCQRPMSNTILQDPTTKIGIFFYVDTNDLASKYIFINDVQVFRYREDADGEPVLIGNVPKSTALQTDYYYLQPEEGTAAEDIQTFAGVDALAGFLNISADAIKPYYNENYEKVSSIEASQSNVFNIIQDLCESFECWAKFNIAHDPDGKISVDANGAPVKTITFHKYSGKDNYAGFKYGINLQSVDKTIDSNEYVSKLIVEPVELEVTQGGTLTIANAESNPTGENYILNFSYYLNQGLISDRNSFTQNLYDFYSELKAANEKYRANSSEVTLLSIAVAKAKARLNEYIALLDEAQTDITEEQNEFVDLVGTSYDDYIATNGLRVDITKDTVERQSVEYKRWTFTYPKGLSELDVAFFDQDGEIINCDVIQDTSSESSIKITYTPLPESGEDDDPGQTLTYLGINAVPGYSPEITSPVEVDKITWPSINPAILDYKDGLVWTIDTQEDAVPTKIIYSLTDDNETLIGIIGKIYTDFTVINQYTGLCDAAKREFEELNLKLNGTKDYSISISTFADEQLQAESTKIRVNDYIEGLKFTLTKSGDETSIYDDETTLLKKDFDYDIAYEKITFKHYPLNYQIRYRVNGKTYYSSNVTSFDLPQNGTISFKLVPIVKVQGLIDKAKGLLDEKDEINNRFYKKYSRYIQEGLWTSDNHVDPELYYFDALQVSNTSAQPQVTFTMNVVEISELPGFENYIFDVGDKTYIEDPPLFGYEVEQIQRTEEFEVSATGEDIVLDLDHRAVKVQSVAWGNQTKESGFGFNYITKELVIPAFLLDGDTPDEVTVTYYYDYETPVREEVIVAETVWSLDDPTQNTITIQNYKTQFADLFQRIAATVQTVEYNQSSYSRAASMLDSSGLINSDLLSQSLANMGLGNALSGDSISLSENGLVSKNKVLGQEHNQLKIDGGRILVSTDGGNSWTTVIDQTGVADTSIDTQEILIKDGENPSFRWDRSGISAYTINNDGSYNLNKFVRYDSNGIYGIVAETIPPKTSRTLAEVKEDASFGLTWEGFFLKNTYADGGMVSISSDEDIQVIDGNNQERIKIGKIGETSSGNQYGINIKNAAGDSVFRTADDGNITVTGTINARGGQFTDSVEVGNGETTIIIRGGDTAENTVIQSSDFGNTSTSGWSIAATGDAVFNNITARGAIKTATFEYSEIQAVGGAFLFRPATTIREAWLEAESADEEGIVYDEDLYLTVENGSQFKVNDWCKVSNFDPNVESSSDLNLENMGLANIYPVAEVSGNRVVLQGAAAGMFPEIFADELPVYDIGPIECVLVDGQCELSEFDFSTNFNYNIVYGENQKINGIPYTITYVNGNIEKTVLALGNLYLYNNGFEDSGENIAIVKDGDDVILYGRQGLSDDTLSGDYYMVYNNNIEELVGGALISFANYDEGNDVLGDNYGIGINSSGDYVNLPPRSISLFETAVQPEETIKIEYDFKAILGTLPQRGNNLGSLYNKYLQNTQGIFTNNMYIGDDDQYLAFYTDTDDNNKKKLRLHGADIVLTYDDGEGGYEEKPLEERLEEIEVKDGEDAAVLTIDSTQGTVFRDNQGTTDLTVTIFYGPRAITNITALHAIEEFANARLEWDYKDNTDNWITLLASDSRIRDNGFTLHLSASADVHNKASFRCKLIS